MVSETAPFFAYRKGLMKMNEINSIKRIDAFEKLFNLKLLYQIFDFAKSVTNNETQKEIDIIFWNGIWSKTENVSETIQNEYGFRYFGEMLERYEERIGSDIKDVRALAIGFSMLESILPDNVYVAGQKDSFIKSLEAYESDYIIDFAIQRIKDGDVNIDCDFDTTDKLIIALSMTRDFSSAFEKLKPQLIEYLGIRKTIPIEDNGGVFDWLAGRIRLYNVQVKKKQDELFRALLVVGNKFLKADSREKVILGKYAYSEKDIAYLSYYFVNEGTYRCRIKPNTIVGEKVSAEFVIRHLNSENSLSESTYYMINREFIRNKYFEIKCNGYSGMLEAIENNISITNPHIFSKVWDKLGNHYYKYIDFFDERWNSLSEYMTPQAYEKMIIDIIICDNTSKSKMRKYMSRYHKLTGKKLLDVYNSGCDYSKKILMNKMVSLGIINLWEWFKKAKENDNKEKLNYVKESAFGNMNEDLFDFWSNFFDTYNITEMDKLFGSNKRSFIYCIDNLYLGSGRRYRFNLHKCNLTDEHMRIYLKWIEEYFFEFETEYYLDFIQSMLLDPKIKELIEFSERKELYDILKNFRPEIVDDREMRDEYFSEMEREERRKREIREKEKQELLKELKEKALFEDNFHSIYDGTFSSVYKFIDRWGFYSSEVRIQNKVKPLFTVMVNRSKFISKDEFSSFLKICAWLAKKSMLSCGELSKMLKKMEE